MLVPTDNATLHAARGALFKGRWMLHRMLQRMLAVTEGAGCSRILRERYRECWTGRWHRQRPLAATEATLDAAEDAAEDAGSERGRGPLTLRSTLRTLQRTLTTLMRTLDASEDAQDAAEEWKFHRLPHAVEDAECEEGRWIGRWAFDRTLDIRLDAGRWVTTESYPEVLLGNVIVAFVGDA